VQVGYILIFAVLGTMISMAIVALSIVNTSRWDSSDTSIKPNKRLKK
jgi:hypothetical protein